MTPLAKEDLEVLRRCEARGVTLTAAEQRALKTGRVPYPRASFLKRVWIAWWVWSLASLAAVVISGGSGVVLVVLLVVAVVMGSYTFKFAH